jgi:enoyl-CoA hydratase/carnithine racemase
MSILVETRHLVEIITVTRPEVGNAYMQLMGEEVTDALLDLDDDPGIRAIAATGSGRTFCAGPGNPQRPPGGRTAAA